MDKLVYIVNGAVWEITPLDTLPKKPNGETWPLEECYPAEHLAACVVVKDDVDVAVGYTYDPATGTFAPPAPVVPDLETLRAAKLGELRAACKAAITAGCDVTLPGAGQTEHYALTEDDQINLTAAANAVALGAEGYLYHADGELCRMYSAADILAIATAATEHKTLHTTLCNHKLTWARRAATAEELAGITYDMYLPDDLWANLRAVLGIKEDLDDADMG
jgi:hypothetical protein